MDWESRKEETNINDFYLEVPEDKLLYPIDYIWKYKTGSIFQLKDNWSVNLDEGKIKPIIVSEINFKKNKKHGR